MSSGRAVALALCALASSCSCEPDFVDCAIKCGTRNACPEGLTCTGGFCRQPNATGICTCRPGDTQPCGSAVGECQPGVQTCASDRTWGACIGEGVPSAEICDGKDNDCNGMVDDNPVDALACEKKVGVCAGKKHACINGQYQLNCGAADYGPDYEAQETRCDGLDNDCDGRADSLRPVKLSDAGVWVLLGFDGGYGLVTARAAGGGFALDGTLYDEALVPLGAPVQLASGAGALAGLAGIAQGDRAVVTWTAQATPPTGPFLPAGFEWLRLAPSAPTPLTGLPPAGERGTGVFSVGLPVGGIIAAHLLDDGGAELLTWASAALAPGVAPFSVPGLGTVQVDAIWVSSRGTSAQWRGTGFDDAGVQVDGGVTALVGTRTSTAQPPGPLFDRPGALQSAWGESILQSLPTVKNESSVQVQYDVWDGGASALLTLPDFRGISSFAATPTPSGLFLAWAEFGRLFVGTPTGGTMMRSTGPFDGGNVFALQAVNGGAVWNAVGWNVNGVNAMLVCAP